MKELFLDSANLDDISLAVRTDAVAGVTTNPSLMAKETKVVSLEPRFSKEKWDHYVKRLDDVCQVFQTRARARKHLSVEVITLDPQEMYDQAHRLRDALGKYDKVQLHVKIPILFESLEVISRLGDDGVKVNATAAMTALQAKLAHDAGAPIVSFFYNRMKDGDLDADMELSLFANDLNRNCRIICGSIRKPEDLQDCWLNGADIVTASLSIIKQVIAHPQTDKAVKQFQEDIDSWLK